ncbi:MAG: NAD(P)/FAD-dependent oxidoreductase [Hyphomicrobiales bacterium]|nr:NAD(P)/FAD-dependent oxidoreductase [Hyphomicrobiales bacterium]
MVLDLLIVGASFAGLVAAKTAAARGLDVAVIDSKREPGANIRTTGILVREAIDEIDIPAHLTRKVPGVRLYAPNLSSVDLFCPGYAFYTTRTAALLRWLTDEAREAGARVLYGLRFDGGSTDNGLIRLDGIDIQTRYLIGADGARSRVAKCFGLNPNRRFLTGVETEFETGDSVDPRFLHCFLSAAFAPGHIAWAAPGPDVIQVGLAVGNGKKPDLAAFLAHTESRFGWRSMKIVERRSGLIPCGGPLRQTASPGVLLIGDAAGWVSPLTGGGIRLAFRHGRRAASYVADHLLNGGAAPEARLVSDVPPLRWKRLLRRAFDLTPPDPLLNLALSTGPMRRAAELVYFHRSAHGVDRDAYQKWLDLEYAGQARPANRLGKTG